MLALEAIGVKSAHISNVTKNIKGHVFVDAYDPTENKFYILDSLFNLMIIGKSNTQQSLVTMIINGENGTKKKSLLKDLRIIALPTTIRFVDPGYTAFQSGALTADFINETRNNRGHMWGKWAQEDGNELKSWWEKNPHHRPQTAGGFAKLIGVELPDDFSPSNEYALNIRRLSGIY